MFSADEVTIFSMSSVRISIYVKNRWSYCATTCQQHVSFNDFNHSCNKKRINTNNVFSNLEMLPSLPSLNDATARCQCHSTRMDPPSTSLLV